MLPDMLVDVSAAFLRAASSRSCSAARLYDGRTRSR